MHSIGSGLQEVLGFATSSSHYDQPVEGFEELAMPLFGSLYNFARWLSHNSNDAEDLVQETYLKAFRSFASFQPGTNFRAWIFQILKNTFLSARARAQRQEAVMLNSDEILELPAGSDDIESILSARS